MEFIVKEYEVYDPVRDFQGNCWARVEGFGLIPTEGIIDVWDDNPTDHSVLQVGGPRGWYAITAEGRVFKTRRPSWAWRPMRACPQKARECIRGFLARGGHTCRF
jgi:hypothetical protein